MCGDYMKEKILVWAVQQSDKPGDEVSIRVNIVGICIWHLLTRFTTNATRITLEPNDSDKKDDTPIRITSKAMKDA